MADPLTLLGSLAFIAFKMRQARHGGHGSGDGSAATETGFAAAGLQLFEHIVGHVTASAAHEDIQEIRRKLTEAFQGLTPDKNLDLERAVARAALHADVFCLMEALHEPTDKNFLARVVDRLPAALRDLRATPDGLFEAADKALLQRAKAACLERLEKLDSHFTSAPVDAHALRSALSGEQQRQLTLDRIREIERDAGGVLPDRARRLFEERWFSYLSTAFAHQIKHNQVVANIYLAISLDDLHAKVDTLQIELETGGVENLFKNQFTPSDEGFTRFSYLVAADEFVGREAIEENLLDAFLGVPGTAGCRGFKWHVILGAAGVGKSRLGKQLLDGATLWPCRGFVDRYVMPDVAWRRWQPEGPTFLVADYAAEYLDSLQKMLNLCAKRSQEFAQPVRLLVVDRAAYEDQIEGRLMSNRAEDGGLRATRFVQKPLKLPPLDRGAFLHIMRGRIARADDRNAGQRIDDATLERALKAVDPECRPLWAALLGEEIGKGRDVSALTARNRLDSAQLRAELMTQVIEREEQRWHVFAVHRYNSEFDASQRLRRHRNLLALATMARELLRDRLDAPATDGNDVDLPEPHAFDEEMYTIMSGERPSRKAPLAALTPDLLGEFFVGRLLESDPDQRALVDLAWSLNPRGAGLFAALAEMDWHASLSDSYLPSTIADDDTETARFAATALVTIAELAVGVSWADSLEHRDDVMRAFRDAAKRDDDKSVRGRPDEREKR